MILTTFVTLVVGATSVIAGTFVMGRIRKLTFTTTSITESTVGLGIPITADSPVAVTGDSMEAKASMVEAARTEWEAAASVVEAAVMVEAAATTKAWATW
jgi:hypothetical protein